MSLPTFYATVKFNSCRFWHCIVFNGNKKVYHSFVHHMHGSAARSAQYPQFYHRLNTVGQLCLESYDQIFENLTC